MNARNVVYFLFVLACAIVAAFWLWTLSGGYDVTLATLQARKAEADARAEVARTEGLWAKTALVQAEANAYVTRELGRVAAQAVERQGFMLIAQQVVFALLVVSAALLNGLVWWGTREK